MMSYHQKQSSGVAEDETSQDPSSGGLFNFNYKKHEDLKEMLDQNKDSLKLEAMKRIIGMIAKGKNASMLFPAVVKNVACKNIEVKKLVYVFLERYAEEQQDLALLSISTFQRGLKDPNQLIRASALRVLSSIRVQIIVPIMLIAIKEGVNDMSPFVRKTAAHAIPKLYSLDPDQKENLIEIIDRLLRDRTTLVAGSVIMAFQEVCPDRIDLVHKHYRNLCSLLVDVDEWGQIAILSMLTRYARTQFMNPNKYENENDDVDKPFYDDDDENDNADSDDEKKSKKKPNYVMDHDHRLLLKSSKPLLQSHNASVVMSVAQLYYHLAPHNEVGTVAKALVRLLRGKREVQAIVLQNIASMTLKRKGIFGPYLKSFYVRSTDPTHVRVLKLEVLTNLASETNISIILREFQTYVRSADKQFVAHTIQAIARCATNISEVTDTCLSGLVYLLSNRDEAVVAESIVVIKKLLQMNPSQHCDIIKHMAKLLDNIQVAMAKASILWLIGEYSEFVPKIAPDVLRKSAKTFTQQEDIVKLQIINLAAKLFVINQKQTKLLTQYVLQLGKYDQNYDIRDRARFIRHLIMPSGGSSGTFHKHAKKILLAPKPAPVLESPFKGRDIYQLGSLSHAINAEAIGYQRLPDFPENQPDPSVRDVELPKLQPDVRKKVKSGRKPPKEKSFYSDEETTEEEESSDDESESGSESDDESESEEESEFESTDTEGPDSRISESDSLPVTKASQIIPIESEESLSVSDSESTTGSDEESSEESDLETPKRAKSKRNESNLLIDFMDSDDLAPPINASSILLPSLACDLQGISLEGGDTLVCDALPTTMARNSFDLLHRVTGEGLSAVYRFPRTPFVYDDKMIAVEVEFHNNGEIPVENIAMGDKKLQTGLKVKEFQSIGKIEPGGTSTCKFGVDFCDTTQPLVFDLRAGTKKFQVSVKVPVGELVKPVMMSQTEFLKQQGRLSGMNENKCKIKIPEKNQRLKCISEKVTDAANVCVVPSTQANIFRFSGKTSHGGVLLLVSILLSDDESGSVCVNCEKMVIGSMIFKQLKESLAKV